jgi:hypothetical protein
MATGIPAFLPAPTTGKNPDAASVLRPKGAQRWENAERALVFGPGEIVEQSFRP